MNTPVLSAEFTKEVSMLLDQAMLKLRHTLNQLTVDQIWHRPDGSNNSAGNLLLHIVGNLNQWGVIPFSGEQDERDRDWEFECNGPIETAELLGKAQTVVDSAKKHWRQLDKDRLVERRTIQGFEVTMMGAIIHTASHFVGHTHQIILLTRQQLGADYKFCWTSDSDRGDVPI